MAMSKQPDAQADLDLLGQPGACQGPVVGDREALAGLGLAGWRGQIEPDAPEGTTWKIEIIAAAIAAIRDRADAMDPRRSEVRKQRGGKPALLRWEQGPEWCPQARGDRIARHRE